MTVGLEEILAELFPSDDPLDQADFDVTQYINSLFPNEQSLGTLDDVILDMTNRIDELDGDVSGLVRAGNQTGIESARLLAQAQGEIGQLVGSIQTIKTRARESERMVSEITRDIKQLDQAKKNLTSTITTLNHLHIVLGGVDDLERITKERDYLKASNLLQGVSNVIEHLDVYAQTVPEVKDLSERMAVIRRDLARHVQADFADAFSATNSGGKIDFENIRNACLVADSLEPVVRDGLIASFVDSRLSEYKLLFDASQEIAWLDKIDRRFQWIKKGLMDLEERFGHVFPANWNVSERLAVQFCDLTCQMIGELLKQRHVELDVKLLLYAIQRASIFEEQLAKRYSGVTLTDAQNDELVEPVPSNPFEDEDNQSGGGGSQSEYSETKMDKKLEQKKKNPFNRLISRSFSPYLSIYVKSQERNLAELIQRFLSDFDNEISQTVEVLPSCADLFVYYKKCLVQCSQLSTGQSLLDLSLVFGQYLREYSNKILLQKLPGGNKGATFEKQISNTFSQVTAMLKDEPGSGQKLTRRELSVTCLLLNSADYCLDTVSALEQKLVEKADAEFKERIDLSQERDLFGSVITTAISLLVQDMEYSCHPALQAMLKSNWGGVDSSNEHSGYVTSLIRHMEEQVPIVRDNLSSARKYYTQFCIKFASSFIGRFNSTLCKLRGISRRGGEQLLRDVEMIHATLANLPSIGSSVQRKPPVSYTKLVDNGMSRIESILRVLMADHTNASNFIADYRQVLPDGDFDTFKKIIDMKDLRRAEAQALIDAYRGVTGIQVESESSDQYSLKKLERLIKNRL